MVTTYEWERIDTYLVTLYILYVCELHILQVNSLICTFNNDLYYILLLVITSYYATQDLKQNV